MTSAHAPRAVPLAGLFMLLTAALSIAANTLGQASLYMLFKPLPLMIAIAWVAQRARSQGHIDALHGMLLFGLTASLAGDVLLLMPGMFVAGLVAFLIAHLAYIDVFRRGVGLLPRPWLLLLTLAIGLGLYVVLWFGGLPAAMRVPVAAYVLVIAAMAAQALGRAAVLRHRAARSVALGACLFMLSDSLLAINRFVSPLPLSPLWVLGSYYLAQFLIARDTPQALGKPL